MQVDQLIEILCRDKKCSHEEALQIVEIIGDINTSSQRMDDHELIKKAFEIWDSQFSKSHRNFGLSLDEFNLLVKRLQSGDQALFEHVFLNHFSDCLNFLVYHKNIPQHVAYDASMDTLLAFRQILVGGKAEYGNLRYFFTRMAVFAAIKIQNRSNRNDSLETLNGLTVAEPEGVDEESVKILGVAWKKLNDECRKILQGFFYDKQSWKDIALLLGATEASARKKGQRCRDTLSVYVKDLI